VLASFLTRNEVHVKCECIQLLRRLLISVLDGRDNDKRQCEIYRVELKSKTEARAPGAV